MSKAPNYSPPRTPFQLQGDLRREMDAAAAAAAAARDQGFLDGEKVGRVMAARLATTQVNKALGAGFLVGFGAGMVLTIALAGWL